MNTTEAKQETVSREELLYNEGRCLDLHDKYGDAHNIKKHVKTSAKIYEIRTALRYYLDGRATHRTSDAIWRRVRLVDRGEVSASEVSKI